MTFNVRKEKVTTVVKRVGTKHREEAHGGAWKVAFADFVLALMCLFLVLWVLAARDKEDLERAISLSPCGYKGIAASPESNYVGAGDRFKGSLIQRFPLNIASRDPHHPNLFRPNSDNKVQNNYGGEGGAKSYNTPQELSELSDKILDLSRYYQLEDHVQIEQLPTGLIIRLHDTDKEGMFALGSPVLKPNFIRLISDLGKILITANNNLLILGHSDAHPFKGGGNLDPNWDLSTERALSARTALQSNVPSKERILQIVGMSDKYPLDIKDPNDAINRRIEIVVLTDEGTQRIEQMLFTHPVDPKLIK